MMRRRKEFVVGKIRQQGVTKVWGVIGRSEKRTT